MKKLLFVLALVLVIGAVLWFVLTSKSSTSETIPISESQLSVPAPVASPKPAPTESAIARPVKMEKPRIAGRVAALDTGQGIEGATVKVTLREEEASFEAEDITDREGNFFVATRDPGEYRIEVAHDVLVSEERRYEATVREGEAVPELVIWMVSGGVVSGRVYDAVSGKGIAGVRVGANRAQTPGVTTDADGRYRLGGLRAGKPRIFLGHAKGYLDPPENSDGVRVTVSMGEEVSDVDFPLQPGVFGIITGKVVDEQGKAVADAEVSAVSYDDLTREGRFGKDTSRLDGSFQVDELPVASGYYVAAKSEGFISEELGPLGLTDEGLHDLVLTLRPTGSISGQVVDENSGKPVGEPEFVVDTRYVSRGRNIIGGRSGKLDEDGNFTIANLPPGPYGLFVDSHPGVFMSGIVEPQITVDLEPGQHLTDIRLTFDYDRYLKSKAASKNAPMESPRQAETARPKVGDVRGQVVNATTNEAVTTFNLATTHNSGGSSTRSSRAVHDPEGRFTIGEDQGETLTITITAKGFTPKQEEVEGGLGAQPAHDIIVRLQPGALVDGEVVDTSGNAVAGAAVYIGVDPSLMDTDGQGSAPDAISGPDGSFHLDTLPVSATTIYATHPSFAVGTAKVTATAAASTRLRIVLRDGGAVEGTVRRSGQPLAEQWIGVLNESGTNVRFGSDRTDSQGHFRLDHVTPGLYTLYAYIDEGSRSLHIDAEVADRMTTQVNFDFDETDNAIEGTVLLDGQQPHSLSVRAEIRTSSGVEKIGFNSQTGAYSLTNLPLGEADLYVIASGPGGARADESLAVSITGGTVRRDFDLHSGE